MPKTRRYKKSLKGHNKKNKKSLKGHNKKNKKYFNRKNTRKSRGGNGMTDEEKRVADGYVGKLILKGIHDSKQINKFFKTNIPNAPQYFINYIIEKVEEKKRIETEKTQRQNMARADTLREAVAKRKEEMGSLISLLGDKGVFTETEPN
jgi:hypothetical protein